MSQAGHGQWMGEAKSHEAGVGLRTPPPCISLAQSMGQPKPGILGQPEVGSMVMGHQSLVGLLAAGGGLVLEVSPAPH